MDMASDRTCCGKVDAGHVLYIYRATANTDIYFISNQTQDNISCTGHFRIDHRLPELWDPVSGVTMDAPVFAS